MTYIKRFKESGIEDHETRQALKYMDSFYKYDRMRESGDIKGTGARPDMKLAFFSAARNLDRAVQRDAQRSIGKRDKAGKDYSHMASRLNEKKKSIGDYLPYSASKGMSDAIGADIRDHGRKGVKGAILGQEKTKPFSGRERVELKRNFGNNLRNGLEGAGLSSNDLADIAGPRSGKGMGGYINRVSGAKNSANSSFKKVKAPKADSSHQRITRPSASQAARDNSLKFNRVNSSHIPGSSLTGKKGLSTGKKVGIGLGIGAGLGAAAYAANKYRNRKKEESDQYEG